MRVNSFLKLFFNFGVKILRDSDFVHFCELSKYCNIGNTWEVNLVKFGGFGECVLMLYRGGSDILMGVGPRFRGVLSFSIIVFFDKIS